ncbi:MAG TPA: GTPase [Rhodanobacteraceae bacterium]|nr:GTPase [Rhodanobacteraceae bacterium]
MSLRLRSLLPFLVLALLLVLLLVATETTVALAQRVATLPLWLQWTVAAVLALFVIATLWLGWRLLRPRRRSREPVPVADRAHTEARIQALDALGADTEPLHGEVAELDRRRAQAMLYVAVFGEISSGKSSLVAALAPQAAVERDVVGGTTRRVSHHAGELADGQPMLLADVPGSAEAGGESAEAEARDEALRAHIVLYVCSGDLNRAQAKELRWLAEFGKPLLLVLNKADQWRPAERAALVERLRQHGRSAASEVVAVSAGGSERYERTLPDGRVERVERARIAAIEPLRQALSRLARTDRDTLETARERAVLGGLDQRIGEAERVARSGQAQEITTRYTRRAAIGALAAVVPGSDLIIQGALATALTRELARLYAVPVSELEIDAFVKRARLTIRTSASIVLAIAGNALKAFPGLGTLGGGVLHAFAYALIFDSLGKALAATFADHHALDQQAAERRLKQLLADRGGDRLKRLSALTAEVVREHDGEERA